MEPYMTSFGIPIVAKFENCSSIEEVKKAMPGKVLKLLKDGFLPLAAERLRKERMEDEKAI